MSEAIWLCHLWASPEFVFVSFFILFFATYLQLILYIPLTILYNLDVFPMKPVLSPKAKSANTHTSAHALTDLSEYIIGHATLAPHISFWMDFRNGDYCNSLLWNVCVYIVHATA